MLKGDYFWQVVEILIVGIATVPEVRFICLFLSFGRIVFQGPVSTNLFGPMRHQVDIWKVEVGV